MTAHPRTWFVVADGARARIVARNPDGVFEDASEIVSANMRMPSRDLGSDRPGRGYESVGATRHALAPRSDPHQRGKVDFARLVADEVNDAGGRDAFDRLVLVALPRTLSAIKQHLSDTASKRLAYEIAKDMTKLPENELRKRLAETRAPPRVE